MRETRILGLLVRKWQGLRAWVLRAHRRRGAQGSAPAHSAVGRAEAARRVRSAPAHGAVGRGEAARRVTHY